MHKKTQWKKKETGKDTNNTFSLCTINLISVRLMNTKNLCKNSVLLSKFIPVQSIYYKYIPS